MSPGQSHPVAPGSPAAGQCRTACAPHPWDVLRTPPGIQPQDCKKKGWNRRFAPFVAHLATPSPLVDRMGGGAAAAAAGEGLPSPGVGGRGPPLGSPQQRAARSAGGSRAAASMQPPSGGPFKGSAAEITCVFIQLIQVIHRVLLVEER